MKTCALIRLRFGTLALTLGLTVTAPAGTSLVGLWRFNEASGNVATDSSGLHDDGTLVGENGNVPTRVPGQTGFGGALRFTNNCDLSDPNHTGDRAYVQIPGSPALKIGMTETNTWSFVCWAYEASDGAGNFRDYYGRIFTQDGGAGLQWESGANGDTQWYLWSGQLTVWQFGLTYNPPVIPVLDQWVHWALVYDGTNVTMYRNGNEPAQGGGVFSYPITASLNFDGYAGSLTIGSQVDFGILSGGRNWNGMLDDFAVFNAALSQSEIRTIMTGDFSAYQTAAPPQVLGQPADQIVNQGLDATFRVTASSQIPATYQWRFDGRDLPGATASTLMLTNVQRNQAGNYSVEVRNASGGTISSNAVLTVLVPLPPRLVGLWRFDEGAGTNVADSSGLTNNGVLASAMDQSGTPGTVLPGWASSQPGFGTALQFYYNGEYNFAYIPASESLKIGLTANDTWTITAWTKEISDGAGGFVSRWGRVFAFDDGWGLNFNSGANGDTEYWIWHNSPGVWQQAFGTSAAVVPILDQWVHLALVYDGQSLTLYRNANLTPQNGAKVSLPARGSVAFSDHGGYQGALQIGSVLNEATDHNWNGLIDDFAVFTGALNETQLATIMSGDFSAFKNNNPLLSMTRSGSQVVVSWGFGTLQTKTDLAGTWQDLTNAVSPLILTPAGTSQFYRVKR